MNRATGRAKSCTTCRQYKLKCDARQQAPNPCSRCVSKGLKCRFDPNFKRISTRRIAQEVADELHSLRAAQNSADSTTRSSDFSQLVVPQPSPSAPSVSHSIRSSAGSQDFHHSTTSKRVKWLNLGEKEVILDQKLQGVIINANTVTSLFKHFDQHYYPHARFLQPITSLNDMSTAHPLLFWTILLVSSERFEGYDNLYEQLSLVHETLLSQLVHIAIQTLEVIQALLLLTLWPVPKVRNSYDPSSNYIGMAIQAAMSLSCHKPMGRDSAALHWRGLGDLSAADLDPGMQSMLWLSCFQIGARLSASLGIPVPMCVPQHSKSLERAKLLAGDLISADERAIIRMLEMRCMAEVHLDAIEDASAHYSMTQAFDAQIDTVKSTAGEDWTTYAELHFQATKLYLFGIAFTLTLPSVVEQRSQAVFYRQIILEKSLQAASSYISTMTELSNMTIGGKRHAMGALTFHPKHYFTTLMMASSTTFHFLLAYEGLTSDQQHHAIQNLMESHKIFQSFPDNRDAMRGAIHIELMVNIIRTQPAANTLPGHELIIKNRLGASVVQDSVFRSTQQRLKRMTDGASPPVNQWTLMNEDYATRLPLAPEQKLASPQSNTWSNTPNSDINLQPELTGWEEWDSYSNDFSVINEPWLLNDAEFNKAYTYQQQAIPSTAATTGIYETALFPPDSIA